jgi:hypothetical protein
MSSTLPHGASGIEFGDFVIEFRRDKVVALSKNLDGHYTLHAGDFSGILDFHRTWTEADGTERHKTLFAIHRSDLPALMAELVPMATDILRLFRPLRVGWLHWNNIGVVKGLDPITDTDIAAITRKRPGKKRVVVDECRVRANLAIPEYLDEIWDFTDGAFSLYKRGRKIGIGIKVTDPMRHVHLYWCKLRDVLRLFTEVENHLSTAALKHAIPKEKYKDYGVLEP